MSPPTRFVENISSSGDGVDVNWCILLLQSDQACESLANGRLVPEKSKTFHVGRGSGEVIPSAAFHFKSHKRTKEPMMLSDPPAEQKEKQHRGSSLG